MLNFSWRNNTSTFACLPEDDEDEEDEEDDEDDDTCPQGGFFPVRLIVFQVANSNTDVSHFGLQGLNVKIWIQLNLLKYGKTNICIWNTR